MICLIKGEYRVEIFHPILLFGPILILGTPEYNVIISTVLHSTEVRVLYDLSEK